MTHAMRGILAMTAAMLAFNVGDTMMKVVGRELPIGEMMLIRGIFATLIGAGFVIVSGAVAKAGMMLQRGVLLRTLLDSACSVLFFLGLMRLPFSDVAALNQFVPLLIMAGAAIFLGAPVGWRRWSAAVVGLIGVLLIIKPGTSAFRMEMLLIVGSMSCIAARDLITRTLSPTLPTAFIVLAACIGSTLTGLSMATLAPWVWPTVRDVWLLGLCAISLLAGYVFIVLATRDVNPATVAPFRYSYMVFAMISSLMVFRERPDASSWLGTALIIGSGLYMLHRERTIEHRRPRGGAQ